MDVRIVLAVLFAVAGSAHAQQVYKCVEGGRATYQSHPCRSGEPVKSWSAQVAPRSPEAVAADRRIELIRQQNAVRQQANTRRPRGSIPGRQGVVIPNGQYESPSRCEAAKAHRDSVYRAVGLKRSFQLSRTMDDQVYEACK